MSETTQDKLVRLRNWRTEFETTIRTRIEELRAEKRQVMDEYDAEIEQLEAELVLVGAPPTERPGTHRNTALADQIYKLLSEHEGRLFSAFEINREVKNHGALKIILADYIADGRIERLGKSYRAGLAPTTAE